MRMPIVTYIWHPIVLYREVPVTVLLGPIDHIAESI